MVGKTVCYHHGGKSLVGPALPQFTEGRYSKYLPTRLLERYHESAADEEMLALREEIALIDSRLGDVLGRVETGESSKIWSDLKDAYSEMQAANQAGDGAAVRAYLVAIGDLIRRGHGDWAAWADVRALVRDRKALVESERKRLVEAQQVVAVDQAMALLALLVDSVRRHVTDEHAVRAIAAEYARLTGIPDTVPALPGGENGSPR